VYTYQPKNPAVLLTAFALSALLTLYCLYVFFTLRAATQAARALDAQMAAVQTVPAKQEQNNRKTSGQWSIYGEHRNNVTATLLQALRRAESSAIASAADEELSACLLGAGNLNDVDLQHLLLDSSAPASSIPRRAFRSLSLVDLDTAAMSSGVARQVAQGALSSSAAVASVRLHTADVTSGGFQQLTNWKRRKVKHDADMAAGRRSKDDPFPPQQEMQAWISSMQAHTDALLQGSVNASRPVGMPGSEPTAAADDSDITVDVSSDSDAGAEEQEPVLTEPAAAAAPESLRAAAPPPRFTVAASVCLLSQLLDMYMGVVGEAHPLFLPGIQALRSAHLALLLDLLQPGGWGVLVSDLVASTTAKTLRRTPNARLPALMTELLHASNFFSGTNPHAIAAQLAAPPSQSRLASLVQPSSVQLLEQPWKWRIGGSEDKTFLVYAILFQRRRT